MASRWRKPRFTRRAAGLLVLLGLTAVSCVDLKEIRAFSDTAAAVGERFPGLAQDLYDSCMSQQRYMVAQRQDFRFDQIADLADAENPLMAAGRKTCQPFADEQPRLVAANGTLVSYMRSLGDLAADDLTNFDQSIGGFGTALAGAGLLSAPEASAISKLAAYLARMATEGYRRGELRRAIADENEDIKVLTAGLKRIVTGNYVLELEKERSMALTYYRKLALESTRYSRLVAQHAAAVGEGESPAAIADVANPVPIDDLRSKFEAKDAAIKSRIAAAMAYGRMLDSVAAGHQQLFDHARDLDSRELLSSLLAEARTIQALASEFITAF